MLLLTLSTVATLIGTTPSRVVCAVDMRAPTAVSASTGDYLQNARAAAQRGDLNTARRQYRVAAALGRDDGCLPVDATNGLARLLHAQSQSSEAADLMVELADEAKTAGNRDVEASALVSAAWLRLDADEPMLAKSLVRRLYVLAKDPSLTRETRALLKESLG